MRRLFMILAASSTMLYGCGSVDLHGAPDVRGLTLPEAQQQLKSAGYGIDVHDDALFGVIIPSHFTICGEHAPLGHLVVADVSKEC